MQLNDVAAEYLASIKLLGKRTQEGYQQRLSVFVDWCADQGISLEQINKRVVDDFVVYLRDLLKPTRKLGNGVSTHTVAGYVRVIQTFLNWCLDDEQYSQHVNIAAVRKIRLPKVEKVIQETFTQEEVERLLAACDKENTKELQVRARAIVCLLIDTGIRADELVSLKLANVSLKPHESWIKVMGKGRKERQLPLPDSVRRAMKWYVQEYRMKGLQIQIEREMELQHVYFPQQKLAFEQKLRANATVFSSRDYRPLTVVGLEALIARLGKYAGLGVRCNPHKFRHTFAYQYMKNGGDVYRLMLWLGHDSVRTTEEYLKSIRGWELLSQERERMSR